MGGTIDLTKKRRKEATNLCCTAQGGLTKVADNTLQLREEVKVNVVGNK